MSEQHNLTHSLSEEELCLYRKHGYLIRESVFSVDELADLTASVERAVSLAHDQSSSGQAYHLDGKRFVDIGNMTVQFEQGDKDEIIRVIEPAHHLDAFLERLVEDVRIVEPVKSIIGVDQVSVWTNKLNLKRAGKGSGFGWHQDSPYWVHDCDHVNLLPNVYLAFDAACAENGCLRVIDKSHLRGCLPGTSDGSQLGGFFTDPACFDESDQVAMEAPAGSLVFFDPHAIHGSEPNLSANPRRAMVLTYQPANFSMLKTGEVRNVT